MAELRDLTIRLIEEVWNGVREESVYELVDLRYRGETGVGPEGYLAWHRDRRVSFPDQQFEILQIVVDGDRVAVRWRGTGTQRGPFGPVPPTGRAVDYQGASFMRFADGRVVENWSVNELFTVLQQLGVTVTPPDAVTD
jgi:predicted ester cyclase